MRAVAKRDRAAMASYLSEKEFCKAIIDAKNNPAKAPPKGEQACVELMTSQNQEALREVTKVVPQGFEPGSTEVMPVAPEKGIWMVLVRPKGFDPHAPDADKQGVMVTVLELAGKRFVVFPRKVEGKKSPAPKK